MRPTIRCLLASIAASVGLLSTTVARADSLATLPPLGPGAYPVGCTSVEQDFSRVPSGQSAEAWWEGLDAPDGSTRYLTDLLSTAATPVLSVPVPDDAELYGPMSGTTQAIALIVCYPTDAANPYADYPLPTGYSVPRMQRSGDAPRISPARERWPVLLFSHGLAGSPISGEYIEALKLLASHGWVVVAPFHGDGRVTDIRLEDLEDLLVAFTKFREYIALQSVRPLALARALDWLLADPLWKDRLLADSVGGFGASLGGESLMLMAGAKLTVSIGLSSRAVIADPRLKAIAGYVPYFGQSFFPSFGRDQSGVEAMLPVPVLSISGTADTTAPWAVTEDAMERLTASRVFVTLEGVAHGFDTPSTGDIFTWSLVFLGAHAGGDRIARATLQRMERVAGGGDDRRRLDYTAPAAPVGDERFVVEFINDSLAHYFYTADVDEAAMLDAGVIVPGWRRTGLRFKAWDRGGAAGASTCRYFYADPASGASTHFYSILVNECSKLASTPRWTFEGDAFRVESPAGDDCPIGRMRVTRLYNNGQRGAPNHRFVTSGSEIAHMVGEGWVVEGSVFCTPP